MCWAISEVVETATRMDVHVLGSSLDDHSEGEIVAASRPSILPLSKSMKRMFGKVKLVTKKIAL